MPDRDDWIRERLERLEPPLRGPRFEEELWERVAARERALTLRWRRASMALALVAAVAVAAAVATARGGGSTVDRTVSCLLRNGGGIPVVAVEAWPTDPRIHAAGVRITTGAETWLLDVETTVTGFTLDGAGCRSTKTKVSLGKDGLPLAGAYPTGYVEFNARCFPSNRVLVRFQLALDGTGRPRRAVVVVRSTAGKLLAFVRWTPGLVLGYAAGTCTT